MIFPLQALKYFEEAEKIRVSQTEQALKRFCLLERQSLEARLNLLSTLEVERKVPLFKNYDVF
jgi:hypothetical protein